MAFVECGADGLPVFHHPAIPCLQVCPLQLDFDDGRVAKLVTYLDESGTWGLCLDDDVPSLGAGAANYGSGSIYRDRQFDELPFGTIEKVDVRLDPEGNIQGIWLSVDGVGVRLLAGEIYEEKGGVRYLLGDESILVFSDAHRLPDSGEFVPM